MTELKGRYYDGKNPLAIPATLDFENGRAILTQGESKETFTFSELSVSPATGRADRFISLPNGGQFSCENCATLNSLRQESPTEGPVFWLEKRWGIAIAGVAVVAAAALLGYFRGLPLAAERLSTKIPMATEKMVGEEVIKSLDHLWAKASNGDPDRLEKLRARFKTLVQGLPNEQFYRLEFRDIKAMGPNAFALPGGIIVVTDSMLDFAFDGEIIAILAHEVGHEELRHPIRLLMQDSAVGVFAGAITNDAATVGGAVAGAPVLIAQLKYSREFESAADDYAFDLLKKRGLSPLAFESVMERFADKYKDTGAASFLSNHPSTADRARKAHEAGMTFDQMMKVTDYRMAPLLRYGQSVKVVPISAFKGTLHRGDVVAIYTKEGGVTLKRLLGLPFDRIELKGDALLLNGGELVKNRLSRADCDKAIAAIYENHRELSNRNVNCYFELIGSSRYQVFMDPFAIEYSMSVQVLKKDQYFVLGDNRITLTPADTKDVNLVPIESVIGVLGR